MCSGICRRPLSVIAGVADSFAWRMFETVRKITLMVAIPAPKLSIRISPKYFYENFYFTINNLHI